MIARALLAASTLVIATASVAWAAPAQPKAATHATKPAPAKAAPAKPAPAKPAKPAPAKPTPAKPAPAKPAPAKPTPAKPPAPSASAPAPAPAPAPPTSAPAPSASASSAPAPSASSAPAAASQPIAPEPSAPAPVVPSLGAAPIPASNPAAPPASVVVDFAVPNGAWFASGLEEVTANELRRFHAITLAKKIDAGRCPTRDPRCFVDQYRREHVDVIVLGNVGKSALDYAVYETWTGTRAFNGSLRLDGIARSDLDRELGDVVRPILQRGGVLDQRPITSAPEKEAPSKPAAKSSFWLPLLVAALIALFASPILLALMMVGPQQLARRPTPASWKWSAVLVLLLSAIPVATTFLDVPALFAVAVLRTPRLLGLLPPVVAGILWGALALTVGVWIFAPIRGLERVREDALWALLRSWLALAIFRALALAILYAPLFVITERTCAEIALPPRVAFGFVLPIAGLLTHFWLMAIVDNLAVYLDVRLVTGAATPRNAWHATIKRYFGGYLKRNVIDIDEKLLERTLFLPGPLPEVLSYGGGFARPRIVIGTKPLEAALGELPDEEEDADRSVNGEELPFGVLVPSLHPASDAELTRGEQMRSKVSHAPPRARGFVPRLLGENATQLGWVLPQPADDGIPLISETSEDFGVVKRLLTEHYAAFDSGITDDEVDDTDPTQKDFLFGALLREIGVAARHDAIFATLYWTLYVATYDGGFFKRVLRFPATLYERFLAGPGSRVADAYVALNTGLHPLVQYLSVLRGVDEDMLTARANVPRLLETSRRMLAKLDASGKDEDFAQRSARDRAEWLLRIFHAGIGAPVRWGRLAGSALAVGVAALLLARSVQSAIAYHPLYLEHLERMKSQVVKPTQGDRGR